jgi:hypothetical protein
MKEIITGSGWEIARFFNATERPFYIAIMSKKIA